MNLHTPGISLSGNSSKSKIPGKVTPDFYPDNKQGFIGVFLV